MNIVKSIAIATLATTLPLAATAHAHLSLLQMKQCRDQHAKLAQQKRELEALKKKAFELKKLKPTKADEVAYNKVAKEFNVLGKDFNDGVKDFNRKCATSGH